MLNALLSSFYFWFLFFFIILFPIFLPLRIRISFHNLRNDNSVSLELEIKLFKNMRVVFFKKTYSPAVTDRRMNHALKYLTRLRKIVHHRKIYWESFRKLYLVFYRFVNSFSWQRFDIFCKMGTGDPAATAILTGSLRFLASIISSHIYRNFSFPGNKPRILMYPYFLKKEFTVYASFEIKSSLARILIHLLLAGWILIKEMISKIFWRWLRNGGSSYSRFNDNSDGKLKRDG